MEFQGLVPDPVFSIFLFGFFFSLDDYLHEKFSAQNISPIVSKHLVDLEALVETSVKARVFSWEDTGPDWSRPYIQQE